jgi:O-antigen/teichoic acid export membrane protein
MSDKIPSGASAQPPTKRAAPTVRRAIVFSFLDSYLGIALNLVSFTLLARLLAPREIGLYSVALAIISVTQVIRDFGLVSFIIQKKELSEEHIGTAWGMSLILGGALFALLQLGAPLIGQFYADPHITTIARVVTLSFLLLPFNSVCLALLRRDMQFPLLMRVNQSAAVLSTLTTLALAWTGMGSLSLAIGAVVTNVAVAIGVALCGVRKRLPRPNLRHWREILHFGGPITFANVITSVAMDINDLVVGKVLGFKSVALVSRAQGLMNLFHRDFMTAVRNVAYPAYAQANRRSGGALEEKYIASLAAITAVAWPFYGFAALFSLEVLRLMFGPQWDQSAPLVPLFCAAGSFSVLISLVQPLMLAAGNSKLVATAELIFQPVRAGLLTLVVYFYRDLHAFATAFLLVAMLQVPLLYTIKQRCLPTDFGALARAVATNLTLAGLTLAPAFLLKLVLCPPGQALSLPLFFACIGITLVTWLVLLRVLKHPLYLEALPIIEARFRRASAPVQPVTPAR